MHKSRSISGLFSFHEIFGSPLMADPANAKSGVGNLRGTEDLVGQVNKQSFISAPDIKHQRSGWRGGWDDLPTEEITLLGSTFHCHSEKRGLPEIEKWLSHEKPGEKEGTADWTVKLVHVHFRVTSGTWVRDICAEDFCKLARIIGLADEIILLDALEVFGLRCIHKSSSAPLSFILKIGRVSFAMWTYDVAKKQTLGLLCFSHAFQRQEHYAEPGLQGAIWRQTVQHPLGFVLDLKKRVTRSMDDDLGKAVRSLAITSTKVLLRMESNAADYNALFEDLALRFYKTFDSQMLRSFSTLKQAYKHKTIQAFMQGLEATQRQDLEQWKHTMLQLDSDLHASLDSRHVEFQLLKDRMTAVQSLVRIHPVSFFVVT